MKKNVVTLWSIILFAFVWLTGCKKESASVENAGEMSDLQVGNNSSCKLTHLVWGPYYTWDFHYDDKGLADEWRFDWNNGYIQNFRMEYDKFNKLIEAPAYDDFGNLIFTNSFTYSGSRVISQKWADLLSGAGGEVLFSYNGKGQIVRRDDKINDTHEELTYDNMGNCVRSDYFIGSYFFYSDRYSFENKVRNPLLTVSGIDYLFPGAGNGYFNKLWFTNNLSIFYDIDGTGYVLNDYDIPQTVFTTGKQNFPVLANYFDKVSQSPLEISFAYTCNVTNNFAEHSSSQSQKAIGTNKIIMRLGSAESIKEQIEQLRRQYRK